MKRNRAWILFSLPLVLLILLAMASVGVFLLLSRQYTDLLRSRAEMQYGRSIVKIVSLARNAVEPILNDMRAGRTGRAETIERIRPLIRSMTYADQDGANYVFMHTYDGIMLVQPFEPEKENTNQWDLRDVNGFYIVRELVKAAKAHREGSFVSYYYGLPSVYEVQRKLTYVIGIPEIGCYIGTGVYMERSIEAQNELLARIRDLSIGLLAVVFVPTSASVLFALQRNRRLGAEIDSRVRAEDEYRSIFENAMEGIVQSTPDGRLISVNPALARMAGFESPREMMEEVPDIRAFYADEADREKLLEALGERGAVHQYAIRLRRRDGSVIWTSANVRTVRDGEGNALYLEGTIEDISPRRKAEAMVNRLAAVVRHASELVNLARRDGMMVFLNEAGCRILGIDENDVEKTNILEVIPDHLRSLAETEILPLLFSGKGWEGDLQYKNLRTGEITDVHAMTFTIEDPEGEGGTYLANVSIDMTERVRLEGERRKLEQQLLQGQKLDAIGTLAGGIAHDFNNVLSGITGYAELAANASEDPFSVREYLREVLAAAERARLLVNQILTFSRRTDTELKEITPKYIIKEALKMLRASIPATVEFRSALNSDASILGDATQLHQVIVNLCANAAYAMRDGTGVMEVGLEDIMADDEFVRLHPGLKPGRHLLLKVSDTGCGIKPEILGKIFEPFFTTKAKGEGTGLGLSVVHGIVENFKGVVTVYSEPGRGSAFNVIVPALEGKREEQPDQAGGAAPLGTERILLLDDEPGIRESLRIGLSKLGYSVEPFSDGRLALETFTKDPGAYDVVVTDYTMPNITGIDIARRMREAREDIPVILCSGYVHGGMEAEALKAGVRAVLKKPVRLFDLASGIRRVLDGPA